MVNLRSSLAFGPPGADARGWGRSLRWHGFIFFFDGGGGGGSPAFVGWLLDCSASLCLGIAVCHRASVAMPSFLLGPLQAALGWHLRRAADFRDCRRP